MLCRDAAYLMQRYRKSNAESLSTLKCYAEMPHILCKDTSNRTKNKILSNVLIYV